MTQQHFFKSAKWVGSARREAATFSVLRGHFHANAGERVSLNVLGLGFFKCYINGVCINPDTFLPLSSDFEASCDPVGEVLSGHRIYVPQFDITPFVKAGDNVIALHFGGGWYTHKCRVFGLPKAIYCITAGNRTYVSDENCRVGDGGMAAYEFVKFEHRTYLGWQDPLAANFDDRTWPSATLTEPLDTEYCTTDCPTDTLIETLTPKELGKGERGGSVYDCNENTTGYPVLTVRAAAGETVEVFFSEGILPNGHLDPTHAHKQRFAVTCDGNTRTVQPEFTWFGFRYFEVVGHADVECVKVVHANVAPTSQFECDNETLNWIYRTFLHTMLCNLHTGHPSDCPHIERRGYTGDGQLTCHTVLSTLDAKALYEKWLQDIADCQDTISGHVQYTAPYIRSGGGPGGWGCAIVEVPYQLYRHYGDRQVLVRYYDAMRRYIDYLEAHSEFGLVTSDKEGEWCLGDWCGPIILYPEKDITSHAQQILVPAAMVNTYFMVKSLETMCEIARIIGREQDMSEYREKAETRKRAIKAAYFNSHDGNFVMNAQGANAFAVDLGLGDERTYKNLVRYYERLGCYDTGIFGTDVLTRILFERGDGELAMTLLTGNGDWGFEHWRQNGATTFHEYWNSTRSRSHNHPMFGAPVAYFFEYLLGIRQKEGTAGYGDLVIAPQALSKCDRMAGSMETPNGRVSVAYQKMNGRICFRITVPPRTKAVLRYDGQDHALSQGENEICVTYV
ncbi:MAG: family 78 glycoside hydrolase catalytic domain [Clostridia bacterium]|nr:family 78 glycoside hydrolase catalytic domain [Clostridia bacterium]